MNTTSNDPALKQITMDLRQFRKSLKNESIETLAQDSCLSHNRNMDMAYFCIESHVKKELIYLDFDGSLWFTSIEGPIIKSHRFRDISSLIAIMHTNQIFWNSPHHLYAMFGGTQKIPPLLFKIHTLIHRLIEYIRKNEVMKNSYSFSQNSTQILFNTSSDHFEFYQEILNWMPKTYWFNAIFYGSPSRKHSLLNRTCIYRFEFNPDHLIVSSFESNTPNSIIPKEISPVFPTRLSNHSISCILTYIFDFLSIVNTIHSSSQKLSDLVSAT